MFFFFFLASPKKESLSGFSLGYFSLQSSGHMVLYRNTVRYNTVLPYYIIPHHRTEPYRASVPCHKHYRTAPYIALLLYRAIRCDYTVPHFRAMQLGAFLTSTLNPRLALASCRPAYGSENPPLHIQYDVMLSTHGPAWPACATTAAAAAAPHVASVTASPASGCQIH